MHPGGGCIPCKIRRKWPPPPPPDRLSGRQPGGRFTNRKGKAFSPRCATLPPT
uniref:Caskin protein-like protein n=1 Tax=Siphoviridae sp. ctBeL15 TaxID=2825374 RepID=A0A8S5V054_9CAUD|nr:MAG TPA: caskin protein-like protein [Siphoviridae sp. ctBeL15]